MAGSSSSTKTINNLLQKIFTVQEQDIACDDCYDAVDQYVDMLRAGKNPAEVLPHVKQHLTQCQCCAVEFRALISILEAAADPEENPLRK